MIFLENELPGKGSRQHCKQAATLAKDPAVPIGLHMCSMEIHWLSSGSLGIEIMVVYLSFLEKGRIFTVGYSEITTRQAYKVKS